MDIPIQRMQQYVYDSLLALWGITNTKYKSYPRCYRGRINDSYVAMNYESKGEYKPAFWDDSFSVVSFFGVGEKITAGTINVVDVHLVFFVNIKKVKPSIPHYGDEEIRLDVTSVIGRGLFSMSYVNMELGLKNVLKEYPGSILDKGLTLVDTYPVHCFRLNFTLKYQNNIC